MKLKQEQIDNVYKKHNILKKLNRECVFNLLDCRDEMFEKENYEHLKTSSVIINAESTYEALTENDLLELSKAFAELYEMCKGGA